MMHKKYITLKSAPARCRLAGDKEFRREIREVASQPRVLEMRAYPQHGDTSCYKHCLRVAYLNYCLCRKLHLDTESAVRAGMLHDLFLYDWHTHAAETGRHFHGLTHPKEAHRNAAETFELNPTEEDIILSHMWPLTFYRFPRTREGWITTFTDKYCGVYEATRRK